MEHSRGPWINKASGSDSAANPDVMDANSQLRKSGGTIDVVVPEAFGSRIYNNTGVPEAFGPRIYNTTFGSDIASGLDVMDVNAQLRKSGGTIDVVLPEAMLMEILSRLPDAKDLATCATVNKSFRSTFSQVKAVRFTCRQKNTDPQLGETRTPFKDTVTSTLMKLNGVETLRIEIEDDLQGMRFKENELDKNSLWLSESAFVDKWLPLVRQTLQTLCVIDYGQQAIFKRSPILQTLSTDCPNLRVLELRNLFLDCQNCEVMKKVTSLTLRLIKLTDSGLKDISQCLPNLETLTLVTVVGLKDAEFKSSNLKVLCLGLATKVNSVRLEVSSLIKLQLKMACPETLQVDAPSLKSLALCLGGNQNLVLKNFGSPNFKNVSQLRELLMGAAEFSTLCTLSGANPLLEVVFLDIPCMAFDDNGAWKCLVQRMTLNIPDMDAIRKACPNLHTLSLGPGLWHSFEQQSTTKRNEEGAVVLPQWPTLRWLLVHIIVLDPETTLSLLIALVKTIPTLVNFEVYVHESSKIGAPELLQSFKPFCRPELKLKFGSWKKGLKFGCFSF